MTPLAFLNEELANVERVLTESLRHEYGPNRSKDYFDECASRLEAMRTQIVAIDATDRFAIASQLAELRHLSQLITLLERSHLGEFSWPFAEEIRKIADSLLCETDLLGKKVKPILHVVADGGAYLIHNETLTGYAATRRVAIVAFPRSLKHHVLLHTIFGHELGHTAFNATSLRTGLAKGLFELIHGSPFADPATANNWLHDPAAPAEIRRELAEYKKRTAVDFALTNEFWQSWIEEFFCDMFGVLLFGPSFAAANEALLRPSLPSDYFTGLDQPTHPPYGLRKLFVTKLLSLAKWDDHVLRPEDRAYEAEGMFIEYLKPPIATPWADTFDNSQVGKSMQTIGDILDIAGPALRYAPPTRETLVDLLTSLAAGVPPVRHSLDAIGNQTLFQTRMSHNLKVIGSNPIPATKLR